MKVKLKRTLMAVAVVAALGASGAHAFNTVTIDRDGAAAGSGWIFANNLGWQPNTVLLQNAFASDSGDTATQDYTLWTQGAVSGFNLASGGSASAVTGSEWTFQLGLSQGAGGLETSGGTAQTTTFSSEKAAVAPINFFKIFYDNNLATQSSALAGTGFGDDNTAGCDPNAPANLAAGKLILCGVVLDGGVSAVLKNQTTARDTADIFVPLDGFGLDNYDGTTSSGEPIGDTKAIGTQRAPSAGGGSLDFNVDVTYQDFAFFVSNVSTLNIGLDLNHTTGLSLDFKQQNPSRLVVGNTWDVGGDAGPVTDGSAPIVSTRFMNNFSCNPAKNESCSFVAQTQGTTSFNANPVPEPGSLALLGIGLLGFLRLRLRSKAVRVV
jgi:hypothetical protein